jgi:hypothetical protein
MGLDAFRSAFGRSCEVHSSGDEILDGEMLATVEARGVKVDLSVSPGTSPRGVEKGERANGLTPDYRGAPDEPYRSNPSVFPAPDPESRRDPLLVPRFSGPPLRGVWPTSIVPAAHTTVFAPRLLRALRRGRPRVIALPIRTDQSAVDRWKTITKNLCHLADHEGVRFVKATALL